MIKQIKASEITGIPPGSRIRIVDVEYIRAEDHPGNHYTEIIFNPVDGWFGVWYRLVSMDDMVDLLFVPR